MNEAFFILGIDAIFIANALIAYVLAWIITVKLPYTIPVKPFNCRPCCTFWLTFGMCLGFSFTAAGYFPGAEAPEVRRAVLFELIGVSFLIGIINFLYIKLKFNVYE